MCTAGCHSATGEDVLPCVTMQMALEGAELSDISHSEVTIIARSQCTWDLKAGDSWTQRTGWWWPEVGAGVWVGVKCV